MEAHVVTFRLCPEHDLYFSTACPACYLEHTRREERYTGRPNYAAIADVAYLAATSARIPPVP